MKAQKTDLRTADGLVVYDLDPLASDLWTVAGPDGVDPTTIDIDDLPQGFRWVTEYEWESLQDTEEPTFGWRVITSANGTGLDGVVFATEQEAEKACEVCKKFSWEDTEFFVVKTTLEPTCTFDDWHAQDWGDEQDEQNEPPMVSHRTSDVMSGYNGWSNFETWSIFVHFTPESKNDVDFAKACFSDAYEELPVFIRNLIDASKINWGEIYTAVYDADNDDDNDNDQDELAKPTILVCNCDEWVRDNCGIDFDGVDEVTIKESVEIFTKDLCEELTSFGFNVEFPTDGKSTYHGWNGFRGFKTRWGVCGTFDAITDEQNDLVNQLISESVVYVENKLVVWSRMRSRTR